MKTARKILIGSALVLAYAASASAVTVSPTSPPSDVGITCEGVGTGTDAAFFATCNINPGNFLYKQNVGGTESGVLAGSYTTTFDSLADASGGTIVWGGNPLPYADCTSVTCWLLVKDGNQDPGRYLFNLSTYSGGPWNGQDTITLSGFWPQNGAISHVSIYGGSAQCTNGNCNPPDEVPEPGTLALLGLGLVGLGAIRRKKTV